MGKTVLPMEKVPRSKAIGKKDFHQRLRDWYDNTDDEVIGSGGRYKGKPWVYVREGSRIFNLNADTGRDAVLEYMKLLDHYGDSISWSPTASERGKMTAVAFGPERVRETSFYLYVSPSRN